MGQSTLVLVRHGQSEWNALNLFTGWKDVGLTQKGIDEARNAGRLLRAEGIAFDIAYTSVLKRAQHTLDIILEELGQTDIEIVRDQALNERDYGNLSGLNKDDARARWGEEQVHIWRRSFDISPPGGESLKQTAERTLPYFDKEIVPQIAQGKTVIVAAHGNSLRSIVMQLDKLSPEEIVKVEIATGVPIVYRIDDGMRVVGKRLLEGAQAPREHPHGA